VSERRASRLVVGLVGGSHLLNHAYMVVLAPVLGLVATEFDASIAAVGLAIGLVNAVVVLLQLPFGHVADTYSRTLVLAVSLVVGSAGVVLTALAQSYETLLAAQVVVGVGVAGHHPAHYPLLSAVTGAGERGRAYSVHAFGGAVGFAAPYAAAAATTALGGGWRLAVGVVGAAGLAYAAASLSVARGLDRDVAHPPGAAATGLGFDVLPRATADIARRARVLPRAAGDLVRHLRAAPGIAGLSLLGFLASAAAWGIRTYTPQLLVGTYGVGAPTANGLVSAMFVCGALTILGGGVLTDRVGVEPVVLGGFAALVGVAAVLASGVAGVAALALVLPLSGTISVSRPARSALADRLSARTDVGKNFALVTIGISLGGAVAPPAFGWLVGAAGAPAVFAVVAVVGVAAAGLTRWILGETARPSGAADATE
jgi:MFS family permease